MRLPGTACWLVAGMIAGVPTFAPRGARAEEPAAVASPSPQPSLSASDADFLQLTAYDCEGAASGSVIRVGDAFPLQIAGVSLPAGVSSDGLSITLPPGSSSLDDQGFAIEKVTVRPESRPSGSPAPPQSVDLTATVVAIRSGHLTLPSLAIVAPSAAPSPTPPRAFARTNPYSIDIASAIKPGDPKAHQPAPPRPPLMIAFPTWILVLAGILGLALVGTALYAAIRWSRSRRKELPPVPAGPPLSEDEKALAELSRLEKSGLLPAGEFKKHAFRVSEILKVYIGERYGFDAPESTTREMLETLKGQAGGMGAEQIGELREMFGKLDRVKFTDHRPEASEVAGSVEEARRFVLTTRKRRVVKLESS